MAVNCDIFEQLVMIVVLVISLLVGVGGVIENNYSLLYNHC